MAKSKNEDREHRIEMDIVVDAYSPEERALSWYYYLKDTLGFPFTAQCVLERAISPLKKGDEVEVIGMPPEDECEHEVFVVIQWAKGGLAVPLAQLKVGRNANADTHQAVGDWLYWVKQGYMF